MRNGTWRSDAAGGCNKRRERMAELDKALLEHGGEIHKEESI